MTTSHVTQASSQTTDAVHTKVERSDASTIFVQAFFWLIHIAPLFAFFTGVTIEAVVCCAVLYVVRVFGITAGYHRYFSHKTFKTSRVMQFILAWVAQSSMQRGVLWWASHHRDHHAHSDREGDPHSPIRETFIKSHVMWLWAEGSDEPRSRVRDLEQYPELVWLNKYWALPPAVTALAVTLLFGLPGLFIGFCLSTVLTWHATFMVNSVAHLFGKRRFETKDQSRNNWFVAIATMGEGWHNNHHHYMNSVRQGFRWWEIDVTYYILKAMSWVGLVWDLKLPPKELTSGTVSTNESAA